MTYRSPMEAVDCTGDHFAQDNLSSCVLWLFSAAERLTSIDRDSVVIVKVAQSCLTLCDPVDYTVHEILLARIPEWVAFPFSRGPS